MTSPSSPVITRLTARKKAALTAGAVALGASAVAFAAVPAQAAPTSTGSATSSAQAVAHRMIPDQAQYQCFSNIVEHESGWNPAATNPSSGAYGLVQALPASKMASAGSDWKTNPATQIKWGLNYMNTTYGSPCAAWAFWQSHNWY
ncbi:transglycosylase SLT domain-containing protein [Streptomyces sp. MST-110588]|uniref:aggregation-promoting factor C-terminal-like domain-containing protein n=1 Tax=Streptomyces sp. MST-110588 TaxID=2833628 RepID=UPI001F5CCFCD|nr:transglycosylase SLT domain-containing protein [Streptomyces sp. MST-110588]